ncbi:hypothetical protein GCK72_010892 [Caenorhabditis remanei]|uniref:Uncharacterized protein n=1 Tax=Caenorhabditis remanei TaxID=31234 RepID=A0A6A5H443_CAERE|nr:hypothetical protein GCK72_010892 [Caenorhabditis remanei]KAF1762630.1 hypothetical protein GCK72_010892 [Caenorhabditis remanei]
MAEGGQQSAMEGASVAAPEAAPAPQEGGQSVAPPVDAGAGGEAPGGGVSQMGGAVGVGGGQEEASIAMVTSTYTKYAQDIQQAAEGVRQRALALQQEGPAQLQQLQSQLQPQTQELMSALQETQAPIGLATSSVVEIFGWSSILLLGAGIASIVGGYVLSPIFGIFIGRAGAAILATLVLPGLAAYQLNAEDGSTSATRFQLLLLALTQGILMGHSISYTYVSGQPLSFITPLVIAFAYPLVAGQVGSARVPLLGGAVGAAFGVQLMAGLVSGSLSFSYFMLAALYSAASGALLQVAFKNLSPPTRAHMYQILLVASFLFSKALVYGLFGSAEPPKAAK